MKMRSVILLGGLPLAVLGAAAFVTLSLRPQETAAVSDPRQEPPIVRLATAAPVTGSERGFTGVIAARVQSNLGFRVAGKIVERLVDVGQQVKGRPAADADRRKPIFAMRLQRSATPLLQRVQ